MNTIVTQLSVPREHPSLPGHFPGHPIVPGVVLLDLVFAAIRAELGPATSLQSIVSTKFTRAVEPEMRIDLEIKFAADQAGLWKARFSATHAGEPVLEGSLLIRAEGAA
jgi:3-hydroxyacyl-[acyl-carrier-protein] dehydratase